jgi:hypothetical protein
MLITKFHDPSKYTGDLSSNVSKNDILISGVDGKFISSIISLFNLLYEEMFPCET